MSISIKEGLGSSYFCVQRLEDRASLGYHTEMFKALNKNDALLFGIVKDEGFRQSRQLDLIASENEAPEPVLEILGSKLTDKYSEGYPGKRYYPGNIYYDKIEKLAQQRALKLFSLSDRNWHVNVQPYSGAIANLAVYLSVLNVGDAILSMGLPSGGHLSHGSRVSFTGKLFNIVNYGVDENYNISYSEIEFLTKKTKPKLIISGASAYPKQIDFERIGKIAHKFGAYHLADISHYAGLISAGLYPSPFENADFVMTTTHKSLFGPRAAIIFANRKSEIAKKNKIDLAIAVDKSVFPGLQGGPHNNVIAAMAYGLKAASEPKAKNYYKQVMKNSAALMEAMADTGFEIVGKGTGSHMFLVKTQLLGMNGAEAENRLEKCGILANRNTIAGDISPLKPSAVRIGTYAVTMRGMKEKEMKLIASLIADALMTRVSPKTIRNNVEKLCLKFNS
jgi:glycine hydroxymethyltransferase